MKRALEVRGTSSSFLEVTSFFGADLISEPRRKASRIFSVGLKAYHILTTEWLARANGYFWRQRYTALSAKENQHFCFGINGIVWLPKNLAAIASLAFASMSLVACGGEPEYAVLDVSKAGNRVEFDASISLLDSPLGGSNFFSIQLGVPETENLAWYKECADAKGADCDFPGQYHVRIWEKSSNELVLDVTDRPKVAYIGVTVFPEYLIHATLAIGRLRISHYRVSVENLEGVSVFKDPVGKVWLQSASK
jgi:hypothetical protein